MSSRRLAMLAGVVVATLASFMMMQSANTQPREGAKNAEAGSSALLGKEFVKGEIVVKLEKDATAGDLQRINQRNDAKTEEAVPETKVKLVALPNDLPVGEAVERYENSPDVAYAEPNYKVYPTRTPNDSFYNELYGLNNTGQTGGASDADIDAPEVWDTTTGSSNVVVAVIDTGTQISHPDLDGNIWRNTDETANNGRDDDANGYVDDVNGWDFAGDDNSVYDSVADDHGTHVSGTIAAEGSNSRGVTGVNWDASIMPLKFITGQGGSTFDAIEAIYYAVDNGAQISNNSWGGYGYSQSLKDAISYADSRGHLFVAAAGNESNNNDVRPSYPASYDNSNIISVAATDDSDLPAAFSNFGPTTVDLDAPGVDIASTYPESNYAYLSGTSMASPHVAGVAALIKAQTPGIGDSAMKSRILGSVDEKAALQGSTVTGGRLNADKALGG